MKDPVFRSELERVRDEAISLADTKLQGLMLEGVYVVEDAMHDPYIGHRLQGARIAIEHTREAQRTRRIERRLDLIDDSINRMKRQL